MGGWKTEDFIGLKVNIHEREEGGGVWGKGSDREKHSKVCFKSAQECVSISKRSELGALSSDAHGQGSKEREVSK